MGSCRMWGFSVRLRLAVCQRAQRLHTYTNPLAIFATLTHHVHGPSAATISREMRDGIPQLNRRIALSVLFDNTKRVLCFFFFFFYEYFIFLAFWYFRGSLGMWVSGWTCFDGRFKSNWARFSCHWRCGGRVEAHTIGDGYPCGLWLRIVTPVVLSTIWSSLPQTASSASDFAVSGWRMSDEWWADGREDIFLEWFFFKHGFLFYYKLRSQTTDDRLFWLEQSSLETTMCLNWIVTTKCGRTKIYY